VNVGTILLLGLLLGMRHALDADHLAAVATLVTRSRSIGQTVLQGLAWGAGHTLTLLLFGGAVLVLGLVLPERAAPALELAVGVMLVVLGAELLYRLWRRRVHFHAHRHRDGAKHFHAHAHEGKSRRHDPERHEHGQGFPLRALLVGMVHGMAGSAALILLSLEALRSPAWGLVYIAVFGIGSIAGMAALSVVIAIPMRLTSRRLTSGRLDRAHGGLSALVGLGTVLLGCYVAFRSVSGMA
jgi:ABC-type nickel/cobalt efflux system permease component RcnA